MDERIKIAIQALETISDPIAAFRRDLKEGEKLDGHYAMMMADDPNYLKQLALNALSAISKVRCKKLDASCSKCPSSLHCDDFE